VTLAILLFLGAIATFSALLNHYMHKGRA